MASIGAVTIGQSPRDDLAGELRPILGPHVEVVQCGALDGLTQDEVRRLAPTMTGDVLVTRMRDGAEVKVGEDFLVPRVQACIRALEDRVELMLLLCTGSFPRFACTRPILYPEQVLYNLVRAIGAARLGVLAPAEEQRAFQMARWQKIVTQVTVDIASPYGAESEIRAAAARLATCELDLVVMDCIGYKGTMKRLVRDITGRPVIQASSALAHVAAELVGIDVNEG